MGTIFFLGFIIFVLIVGITIFSIGLIGYIIIKECKRKKSKSVKKIFKILSVVGIVLGLIIMLIPISFGVFIGYVNYSEAQYKKSIEYAADKLNYDSVLTFLEKGVDPDECRDSYTPLMHVCTGSDTSSKRYEVAKLLIQYGANVNVEFEGYDNGCGKGYTALFYAVEFKDKTNLVQLLIDNNADLNHRAADGKTPLTIAKEMTEKGIGGNYEIIQLLIDNGACE